jgi:rare lipoprotein A (peptidoglycan hydrolase)
MRTAPLEAGGLAPRLPATALRAIVKVLGVWLMAAALVGMSATRAGATDDEGAYVQIGRASWYGQEFASRRTASGVRFDPTRLTGAHRTLPLGARVRVTNLHNGRSVLITINDRGPFRAKRDIDLSLGAARALGMVERGIARVRIELLDS